MNRCTVLMHTDQQFYNWTGGQVVKVWDFHVGGPGSIPGPAAFSVSQANLLVKS